MQQKDNFKRVNIPTTTGIFFRFLRDKARQQISKIQKQTHEKIWYQHTYFLTG